MLAHRKIIVRKGVYVEIRKICSFARMMQINIGLMPRILTIRENGSGKYESEIARIDRIEIPFCETKPEDNGLRAPPGLTNKRNVSSAKPEVSLSTMLPKGRTLGPNRPLPRRKSEATTQVDGDSTFHRNKGGVKWGEKLTAYSKGPSLNTKEKWGRRNVYFTDVRPGGYSKIGY